MIATTKLIQLVMQFRYLILFPVAMFEGPIITIISGFLVSKGVLNFYPAFAILVLGDIAGDTFYYAIGRWGRHPFILRWGRFLGLTEGRIQYTESHFDKHAGKTLLFGKTQPYGSVILVAAGLAKTPFTKFILYNIFGTIIKTSILLVIGFYFGQAYNLIDHYFNLFGLVLTGIALSIIITYIVYRNFYAKNRNRN